MDWGRKWLVDFNAGKTQLVLFDQSNNTGAIDMKMDGFVLEEKSSFKMLGLTFFYFFLNCYLAAPRPALGHYRGDSLTHPMLISAFLHFWLKSHQEPHNEAGSLSQVMHMVGFELGTFWFLLKCLHPLGILF